jgi:hypothetical protein
MKTHGLLPPGKAWNGCVCVFVCVCMCVCLCVCMCDGNLIWFLIHIEKQLNHSTVIVFNQMDLKDKAGMRLWLFLIGHIPDYTTTQLQRYFPCGQPDTISTLLHLCFSPKQRQKSNPVGGSYLYEYRWYLLNVYLNWDGYRNIDKRETVIRCLHHSISSQSLFTTLPKCSWFLRD